MDKPTQQKIDNLHPLVRHEVSKIIEQCDTALTGRAKLRITQGLRTFQEQDALYAQGRTTKGKVVTNAKGGQSIHNFGFAIDFCLIIDGKEVSWDTVKDYDGDKVSDWMEVVKIFKEHGWFWGGEFKSIKDYPHFEKIGFNDWKKLLKLSRDKNGYVIIQ